MKLSMLCSSVSVMKLGRRARPGTGVALTLKACFEFPSSQY